MDFITLSYLTEDNPPDNYRRDGWVYARGLVAELKPFLVRETEDTPRGDASNSSSTLSPSERRRTRLDGIAVGVFTHTAYAYALIQPQTAVPTNSNIHMSIRPHTDTRFR